MAAQVNPDELLDRVQSLSAGVEELPDGYARELAQELVSAIIAMYGDGLRRIVEAIGRARDAGATILDELAQDGVVSSLLLIHDLYPVPLEERVREALDTVRPYMESHGGNVELVGLDGGVARLVLQGSCNGCAASRATLELAIKQALEDHAPDLAGLEVEGVAHAEPALGGFELPMVHAGGTPLPMPDGAGARPARWVPLDVAVSVAPGELRGMEAEGQPLLLANLGGSLVAYRNACAACGAPLHDAALEATMVRCPACEVEFDLRGAGRAAGGEPHQLTPVPLLEAGGVRVAL